MAAGPSLKIRAQRNGRLSAWVTANGLYIHASGDSEDVVRLLIEFERVAETRLPAPEELAPLFGRLRLIEGQMSLDEGANDECNDDPRAEPGTAFDGAGPGEQGTGRAGRVEAEATAA